MSPCEASYVSPASQTGDSHYIVKSYYGTDKWYRIYDDGWIEQGGYANYIISGPEVTLIGYKRISFPIFFKQTIATFTCSNDAKWPNAFMIRTSDMDNNGFSISEDNPNENRAGEGQKIMVYYYACGF